jgi:hypothetical protein
MSGNTPNVSRNNYSYSHSLSGGKSVLYDGVSLQQGVPVVDSDVNELQDYRRMNEQLFHKALLSTNSGILFGQEPAISGFIPYQASSPANNFGLRAGYALVEGVVIPTTTATTPAAFDYKAQVLYSGIFTGISGSDLADDSKNWSSADQLPVSVVSPKHVACIIKITSGTENDHWGYILANTATTVTIDALTQVNRNDGSALKTLIVPANIVVGDTYEIYVPPLTTPGASRTDYVYLQVWFDDICDAEDSSIVNTDVGVEAVHKIAKRWAVRVSEDGALAFSSSFTDFGHKYFPYATFARTSGIANITSVMIALTSSAQAFGNLTKIAPESVYFNTGEMLTAGYHTIGILANVQAAVDRIVTELYSTTAGYGAARIRNAAISGTPDTLPAGDIATMISSLLGFVNNRVREYEPTLAATLLSGGPVLVWRSHGAIADGTVTKDTVSIYVAQLASAEGAIIEIVGGYLSGANCYRAPTGTAPTYVSMRMHKNSGSLEAIKDSPSASPWTWEPASSWSSYFTTNGTIYSVFGKNFLFDESVLFLDDAHINVSTGPTSAPRRLISAETTHSTFSTSSRPGLWMASDGMWLTQNCYYNSGKWNAHDLSKDALATHYTDTGITHYYKVQTEVATPWNRITASVYPATNGWTTSMKIHTTSLIPEPILFDGGVREVIPFDYLGYCPAGGGYGVVRIPIHFNFPRRIAPIVPTYGGGGIILSSVTNTNLTTFPPTYNPNSVYPQKGGSLYMVAATNFEGDAFHGYGYISFYY